MDIVVEVGMPEDQEAIKNELSFVVAVAENLEIPLQLNLIIVARDFDKIVRELDKNSTYESERGFGESLITAQAKVVHLDEGYGIVLSPTLYTEWQDSLTRYFVFLHELMHIVNRHKFPELDPKWRDHCYGRTNYIGNLHRLFDEYSADHFAYNVIEEFFPEKSRIWDEKLKASAESYTSLLTDIAYYEKIQSEVTDCLAGLINPMRFLENIHQSFDEVGLVTVHAFSLLHVYPDSIKLDDLRASKFINEKTIRLVDFFQSCVTDPDANLEDGLPLLADYLTNFGFEFEDRPDGTHVQILEI